MNEYSKTHFSTLSRIAAPAVAIAVLCGATPSKATGIEVVVVMVLKDQAVSLAKLIFHQLFDDNRSAVATACTDSGCGTDSNASGWFSSAEATAVSLSFDRPGLAFAHSLNSLGTKTVQPTGGLGEFGSYAAIAWKGVVKMEYRSPNSPTMLALGELPDPADVAFAYYDATWTTSFSDFGYSFGTYGSGAAGIDIAINGASVFSGGVASGNGSGLAQFSGDLASYASQFTISGNGVNAAQLNLGGSFTGAVDYASFYADPSLLFDVNGSAFAEAAGDVPEPESWLMLILGFGIVGIALRRGRRGVRMAA